MRDGVYRLFLCSQIGATGAFLRCRGKAAASVRQFVFSRTDLALTHTKLDPYIIAGHIPGMVALHGDIAAGFPSAAEGFEDEPLDLHKWLVPRPAATFFYRVQGNNLSHEHICDGSVLVVDRSLTPARGRLVLIEADGAFAVTRYQPAGDPSTVVGVVTAVITRM